MTSISLQTLIDANQSLKNAISPLPANDRERDGAIQRFEYTVELAWRLIRKKLLELGRADISASPKPIIRQAAAEGWITEVDSWLAFIEARNLSSHSYKNAIADQVFAAAQKFPSLVDALIARLK